MAALDWTNERVERLRKHAVADAAQLDELATDVELALVSARSITALVRDFQLFLRPDEVTPIIGAAEVKPRSNARFRWRARASARSLRCRPISAKRRTCGCPRRASRRSSSTCCSTRRTRWRTGVERQLRRCGGADGRRPRRHRGARQRPGHDPGDAAQPFRAGPHGEERTDGRTQHVAGLGLAISRQLARLSGGDITVTCPPSGGTVFRVVLPRR